MLGGLGALNKVGQAVAKSLPPSSASLYLDFTLGTLDSRITFTRGSNATLFDSAGTLRYAKHNLILYSQKLDESASWNLTGAGATITATTDIAAPNGTLTAWTLTSSGAAVQIQQAIGNQIGVSYTGSFWIRRRSGTGTINIRVAENLNIPLSGVTSDWQRFNFSATSTTSTIRLGISLSGTSDAVDIWGGQLNFSNMEGGVTSSLTTYYPTTTAAYYGPRFDYDPSTLAARGLLIEEARTNSIRNNTMVGAVAGTPGTLPTNWVQSALGTLTQQIVGTGTENGISYVDIRYSGTTANTLISLQFDLNTQVAAATGQSWTSSFWIKEAGGSQTNITSISNRIRQIDAGGTAVATGTQVIALNTTFSRNTFSGILTNASTAFVASQIAIAFASGVAIDITLRIGLPQLELGAFATSVIPTTTTALTRNADVATMTGTNFSSWYNASEGTLFVEGSTAVAADTYIFADMNSGVTNNYIRQSTTSAGTANQFVVHVTGSTLASPGVTVTLGSSRKMAGAYILDSVQQAVNGTLATEDTSVAIPTGLSQMNLGSRANSTNDSQVWLARIAYYPVRLANSQLQALTA